MKQVGSFREVEHSRRQSRQSFRSQELLTSLTLSAEAITLRNESGDPEEAAARASRHTRRRSTPKAQSLDPQQGVVNVSNAKLLLKKFNSAHKYRLGVHDSLREEDADEALEGLSIKLKRRSLMPISPAILPGQILPTPIPQPPAKYQDKHAIGSFETVDSKWKATIEGEVEKFMYPSLRLEALYGELIPDPVDDPDESPSKPMPSPKTIDTMLTSTSKVSWEVEHVAPSSVPVVHVQEVDSKRLQFDQKLQDAEGILRKREATSLRLAITPTVAKRASSSLDELKAVKETESLPLETATANQQPIPRLPQTRKNMKEIQRHTTHSGQIEYYADKQHLFTKWRKVQVSQQHQLSPLHLSCDNEDDDSDNEPQLEVDRVNQPFGKLSPRSLFYHECVKNQILPEAIFSRINEIAAPSSQPSTARVGPAPSLASVASMLISGRSKRRLALQLQQFGLGDAKIMALSKSLREFQALQVLDLSDNRLTDASIIPLLQALATGRSPRSAKDKFLAAASQTTRRNSSGEPQEGCILTVLNLSKNELGRKGCQQVACFLDVCRTLTFLDLSHTTLGGDDEAFAPVAAAIEFHPSLKRVNLSHNSIGERGGVLLGTMLTNPSCVVRDLDVSWNSIRRTGAVALGLAMRTNTSLKTLQMSMNRCGDGGGEQLAAALACNTTLTQLDLSHNALTGASAVTFGFFLRQNQALRTLDMKDNNLGEVGARALLRAIALGSRCEISLSVHDLETSSTTATASSSIFDASLPSASSPFELQIGESPYAFAVASELLDAALHQGRCALAEISYEGNSGENPRSAGTVRRSGRAKSAKTKVVLVVDQDRKCLYSMSDSSKVPWKLPAKGVLRATATFTAPPLPRGPVSWLDETSCLGLIQIVKRGFSSRDMMSLLDLVLTDLHLTTTQATFFISHLHPLLPKMELLGRLWPCLIDGDNVFAFLQQHSNQSEQWRLIDRFGPVVMQFSTANPTGHWTLTLRNPRHRKLALWFASLNAHHTSVLSRCQQKRTDCSQYGRGFHWRNSVFNQKRIQLTYTFFDCLPRDGVLEFDYVSPTRPEDKYVDDIPLESQNGAEGDQTVMTDDELATLLAQVGAEVCAIYVPVHKRQNLKYHLVLFHLAIASRRVLTRQAHYVLQHFPKNYESGRLRALVAMHHAIVDLECFGELLERLAVTDRSRVYMTLGYLNTVMPLAVDMDFEVDFTREDEKMLLRALVDLSISCPMDMIRIDSTRSTVLIIYSMYQTNTVPATGRICFRYVTHQGGNRLDWLRARRQIYNHFLCGGRLKSLSDSAALALAAGVGSCDIIVGGSSIPVDGGNSAAIPS